MFRTLNCESQQFTVPFELYRAAQVRELDRIAIQDFGILGLTLMKRAGKFAFDVLRHRWPHAQNITVMCGAGNNAGDGYILASLAHTAGLKVTVFQVGNIEKIHGDALLALQELRQLGINPIPFSNGCLTGAKLIVDALLGTGLTGEVRSPFKEAINAINQLGVPILAIDIPSGLCADTGQPLGLAVTASISVTFIGLKLGLVIGNGAEYSGEIFFSDLQIPDKSYSLISPAAQLLNLENLAHRWLVPRPRTAHKGNFGHVLVIGGAPGYAGAGRLAAEAAVRAGAGLVSLATHPYHAHQIAAQRPEIMAHAVDHPNDLAPLLEKATVIVLGPGLSRSKWAIQLWEAALTANLPMVLDADALNILSEQFNRLPNLGNDWIFTPHLGEAARLLNCTVATIQSNRLSTLESLISRYGGIWILKGAGTVVGNAGLIHGVCPIANAALATGGTGDVLSGLLGGLIAQKIPVADAARLGVCVHAVAALKCAQQDGERGMLASDLMPFIRKIVSTKGD